MFPIKAHLALILLLLASKSQPFHWVAILFFQWQRPFCRVVRNCDRFAWIRAGKIPQEAFSAWSKEAQKEKVKCENGEINQKIFAMAEAVTT